MIVSELISKLNRMVSTGKILPDCEVVVSSRDERSGAPLEDMYITSVGWFYLDPDDESVENRVLSIKALSNIL
jgi:hypothetical protein